MSNGLFLVLRSCQKIGTSLVMCFLENGIIVWLCFVTNSMPTLGPSIVFLQWKSCSFLFFPLSVLYAMTTTSEIAARDLWCLCKVIYHHGIYTTCFLCMSYIRCSRLKSSMPFKHDLALQNTPLYKQPFKMQPQIGNEDVT